jgi:PKHD-type hydroxylase
MLLQIPGVLTKAEVREARERLAAAPWVDGRVTAGHQSAQVKSNEQVPEDHETARALGDQVLRALSRQPLFTSAALPRRIFPPLFNRYAKGMAFGAHIDNAVRAVPGTGARMRTDLSATLFLSEPDEYDGGELVIDDTFGARNVKLPAGDLVLYPATSVHRVEKITQGERLAAFFWIESLVRDDSERTLLFDLDRAIAEMTASAGQTPASVRLTAVYHNLVRKWADA